MPTPEKQNTRHGVEGSPDGQGSIDPTELKQALAILQERFQQKDAGVTFAIESSERSVNVTVISKDSERVLMRIPAQSAIRLAQEDSLKTGGLLDRLY